MVAPKTASIEILCNVESGALNIRHPDNLLVTLDILSRVERAVFDKYVKQQMGADQSRVAIAGEAAMRALPKMNGDGK